MHSSSPCTQVHTSISLSSAYHHSIGHLQGERGLPRSYSPTCYPYMPIGKVWIYRLLFFCLFVCTVTDFSAQLAASNFARRFIGVQGRKSHTLGNFALPGAQNRPANRPSLALNSKQNWKEPRLAGRPRLKSERRSIYSSVSAQATRARHVWIYVSSTDLLVLLPNPLDIGGQLIVFDRPNVFPVT